MTIKHALIGSALLAATGLVASPDAAAQEDYIGEIKLVPFTFCPRGTAPADGQLIAISQNSALFSLYGTNFGGDGSTTFALPDMRGRAPIHLGQGPGLSNYNIGQKGGQETVTLKAAESPPHAHDAKVEVASEKPSAHSAAEQEAFVTGTLPNDMSLNSGTVTMDNSGGSLSQPNMQPYITLRYCVVLQGLYPSRN